MSGWRVAAVVAKCLIAVDLTLVAGLLAGAAWFDRCEERRDADEWQRELANKSTPPKT